MATTTPNFGWPVPTSTDLVKNGATAIEGLGDAIDASLLDLKGGTTGQVLSKASNTDMDFTWVTDAAGDITGVTAGTGISGGGTSGTVTVTNSMATAITTAGDLIKGTGAGTFDRLGIGSTGQVLTVAAGAPSWATPATAGFVGANAYRTSSSITITSNTWTYITFGAELYDTDAFHDNSTNTSRFTVPTGKGGKYMLNFAATFDGAASDYFYLQFFKNGGNALQSGAGVYGQHKQWGANNWSQSISTVTSLSAGDYVEGAVLNASTQTNTLYGIFSITYLGA
jgi:hypothetical protein